MNEFMNYYGVPLPKLADDEVPLGVVLSMKSIKDGRIQYREFKSSDLHAIEALGMITIFEDALRLHIQNTGSQNGG